MRVLIIIALVALLACLATSSPIDPKRQLINRPPKDLMLLRRAVRSEENIKGRRPQVKGESNRHIPELNLRKGEYICGGRVCKLSVNDAPAGCNGVCQYPVKPHFNTQP